MKELYFIVAKNNLNVQPTSSAFSDTPTPVLIEKKETKNSFSIVDTIRAPKLHTYQIRAFQISHNNSIQQGFSF